MNKKQLLNQLKAHGFSESIIKAFEKTDRTKFIPGEYKEQSYYDTALPIGCGQTISQPYTIAFMLTLLEINPDKNQKILEIGSGSGYVLELIHHLSPGSKIFGMERIKQLAQSSKERVSAYKNIKVINSQGEKGLESEKPFDRILISASCKEMPSHLTKQLKFKGILVSPVRDSIIRLKKESGGNKIQEYPGFVFVPLVKTKT
jgi:protein-L-isoaspartate(D-aspartate) O-methyltransferase